MLVALAVLAPRFRLRHATDAPVRPELLVTLRPAGGLPMRAERPSRAAGAAGGVTGGPGSGR